MEQYGQGHGLTHRSCAEILLELLLFPMIATDNRTTCCKEVLETLLYLREIEHTPHDTSCGRQMNKVRSVRHVVAGIRCKRFWDTLNLPSLTSSQQTELRWPTSAHNVSPPPMC